MALRIGVGGYSSRCILRMECRSITMVYVRIGVDYWISEELWSGRKVFLYVRGKLGAE